MVWGGGRDGDGDGHDGHDEDQPRRHCGSGARGSRVLRQRPSAAELFVSAHLSQKTDVQLVSHSILPSFIFVLWFFLWEKNMYALETKRPPKFTTLQGTENDIQRHPGKAQPFFCCVATRFVVLSGQVSACSQEQKPFESFWTLQMFLPTFGYLYHQPEFLVRLKKVTSNFMKHLESQHFVTSSWSHSARWNDRPGPWSQAQKGFGQKYRLQRNTGNTM